MIKMMKNDDNILPLILLFPLFVLLGISSLTDEKPSCEEFAYLPQPPTMGFYFGCLSLRDEQHIYGSGTGSLAHLTENWTC